MKIKNLMYSALLPLLVMYGCNKIDKKENDSNTLISESLRSSVESYLDSSMGMENQTYFKKEDGKYIYVAGPDSSLIGTSFPELDKILGYIPFDSLKYKGPLSGKKLEMHELY